MGLNRTRASLLSILSNAGAQILTILLEFGVRSVFIYKLGESYLGVNGLFQNILSMLSLAELGIGSAITYYLYRPAATNDIERLKSLMRLYKLCYNTIGIVILLLGTALIPFLHLLVNLDVALPVNLYLVYFLYVLNSALTYLLYAYKTSAFMAFQQMHKVAGIKAVTKAASAVAAITLLLCTGNFYAYLLVLIGTTVGHNLLLSFVADRMFPFLKDKNCTRISREELKEIFKNIYAVFVFNVGSTIVNSTDNILISVICGTIVVGYYSNYTMITMAVTTGYRAVMDALLPSVGNLNAQTDDEKQIKVLRDLNFCHSWFLSFCAISLMVLLPPFVYLWTSRTGNIGYVLPEIIPILLGLNFWINWYMHIVTQFKTTKGLFRYGKYVQLFEGFVNLILSVILGRIWGLFGIVIATTISMLGIGFLPYPYFLFHYGYNKSPLPFLSVCMKDFAVMAVGYAAVRVLSMWIRQITVITFAYQCLLCLIVPNTIIYFVNRKTSQMQTVKNVLARFTTGKAQR